MKKLFFALLLLLPAPAFAVKVVSGSFAANTATGNQTIDTGVDSVLKAIRFYGTLQTATGLADQHAGFHGMAVSSSKRKVVSWYSSDTSAGATVAATRASDSCILWLNRNSTIDGAADFVSFGTGADAGKFTINIVNGPAAAYLVYYEAYYGDALSNVNLTQHTHTTGTGSESETGVGFEPTFIIFMTAGAATVLGDIPDVNFGIGAAAAVGDCISSGFWADSGDGAGGYAPVSHQGSSYRNLVGFSVAGSAWSDSLLSFDPDGFTFYRISTSGSTVLFWALSFRGGQYDVGSFDSPAAGGTPQDQTITTSFLPNGVSFLQTANATTLNTNVQEAHLTFGFGYDSSSTIKEQYAVGLTDNVRAATVTGMGNSNAKCIIHTNPGSPPTVFAEADYKTQTSTSFTVTWTTIGASARRFQYMVFGSPAEACPSGPKSAGTTTTNQFTNPNNVFTSNNVYASEGTVNDTMAAYDFGLAPTSGNNIDGITVSVEMGCTGAGCAETATMDVRLSWNGGVNWTSAKSDIIPNAENPVPYGGATDTWGRSWTATELNNPNFRVALKYTSEAAAGDGVNVDYVTVTVACSAPGGAGNIRRQRLLRSELLEGENEESPITDGLPIRTGR